MKLVNYLPEILQNIPAFQVLMDSEEVEIDDIKASVDDVFKQKFIEEATWGLEYWERELGLQVNPSLSDEERRARIKSGLRRNGKVDTELIKQVADSWTNGDVEVLFDGIIKVQFTSFLGTPSNVDDVRKALETIIPAHLRLELNNRYLTIGELEQLTIAELEQQQLHKFAPFV